MRIDRRHQGQVVRVEGTGRGLRLVVEDARDLRRRTVDPARRRVERLQAGARRAGGDLSRRRTAQYPLAP